MKWLDIPTIDGHGKECAHYGDSMMPCTCGADPNIVGCHYDENGKLVTNDPPAKPEAQVSQ